ncbi:hypothetical protein LSAT2_005868 [Lamellibrachia satsuma]|nr:hypothetical protein LSAT2_005868 [Lamellibrachia satsuma]
MGIICLLGVGLVSLFAVGAAQHVDQLWTVSADGERSASDHHVTIGHEQDVPSAPSREKRATCGVPYKFTRAQRRDALRAHNRLRWLERASNMMRLRWSHRLARRAHQWAAQCRWKSGMQSDCNGGRPIGQNMYMTMNGRDYPTVNVSVVIANSWGPEKKFYDYNTMKCLENKTCDHYTQVVWAQSHEVGCSIAQCPVVRVGLARPWTKAVILVCDYAAS